MGKNGLKMLMLSLAAVLAMVVAGAAVSGDGSEDYSYADTGDIGSGTVVGSWDYTDTVLTLTYTTASTDVTLTGFTGTPSEITKVVVIGNTSDITDALTAFGATNAAVVYQGNIYQSSGSTSVNTTVIGTWTYDLSSTTITLAAASGYSTLSYYLNNTASNHSIWYNYYFTDEVTTAVITGFTDDGNNNATYIFKDFSALETVTSDSITLDSAAMFNGTTVKYVSFTGSTNIPSFDGNTNIVSADFRSATYVSNYEFQNCTSLVSVDARSATGAGYYAFYGCTSLTTVRMDVATSIGNRCFQGCTSLQTITEENLPVLSSMGVSAFKGCTSLSTVNLPKLLTVSDASSYGSDEGAFYGCTSLSTVNLPIATSLGTRAFYGCTSLATVDIPSVRNIMSYAFYGCTGLSTINIENATTLGNYAFSGCTALKTITSNSAVTSLGNYVFENCGQLGSDTNSITFSGVTTVGSYAFTGCDSLTSIYLPATTTLGDYAF